MRKILHNPEDNNHGAQNREEMIQKFNDKSLSEWGAVVVAPRVSYNLYTFTRATNGDFSRSH